MRWWHLWRFMGMRHHQCLMLLIPEDGQERAKNFWCSVWPLYVLAMALMQNDLHTVQVYSDCSSACTGGHSTIRCVPPCRRRRAVFASDQCQRHRAGLPGCWNSVAYLSAVAAGRSRIISWGRRDLSGKTLVEHVDTIAPIGILPYGNTIMV